jgi:hypothetical protein
MAKEKPETVEVPVATLQAMQARLDALELREQVRAEAALRPTRVLDQAWEAEKAELSRPAKERTQDAADRRFGTAAPRFRCRLDSTGEGGKPGPRVAEHFELTVSAGDPLHAQARYLETMGITQHQYKVATEPVA